MENEKFNTLFNNEIPTHNLDIKLRFENFKILCAQNLNFNYILYSSIRISSTYLFYFILVSNNFKFPWNHNNPNQKETLNCISYKSFNHKTTVNFDNFFFLHQYFIEFILHKLRTEFYSACGKKFKGFYCFKLYFNKNG